MGNEHIIEKCHTMEKRTADCSSMLAERRSYLEKQLKVVKESLVSAPDGHLKVSSRNGKLKYYYRAANSAGKNNAVREKYLGQSEIQLALLLVQKDYELELVSRMEAELRAINSYFRKLRLPVAEDVYQNLTSGRKVLVRPI